MRLQWEAQIRYHLPLHAMLNVIGDVIVQQAKERIYNGDELEPIKKFVPANLKWRTSKKAKTGMMGRGSTMTRGKVAKLKIYEEMYQDRGGAGAKPLLDTGNLAGSLHVSSIGDDYVVIGSYADYAALQQFGGKSIIDSRKTDRWEQKYGVTFAKNQEIEVMGRNYVRWSDKEKTEVYAVIREIIRRANGRAN